MIKVSLIFVLIGLACHPNLEVVDKNKKLKRSNYIANKWIFHPIVIPDSVTLFDDHLAIYSLKHVPSRAQPDTFALIRGWSPFWQAGSHAEQLTTGLSERRSPSYMLFSVTCDKNVNCACGEWKLITWLTGLVFLCENLKQRAFCWNIRVQRTCTSHRTPNQACVQLDSPAVVCFQKKVQWNRRCHWSR